MLTCVYARLHPTIGFESDHQRNQLFKKNHPLDVLPISTNGAARPHCRGGSNPALFVIALNPTWVQTTRKRRNMLDRVHLRGDLPSKDTHFLAYHPKAHRRRTKHSQGVAQLCNLSICQEDVSAVQNLIETVQRICCSRNHEVDFLRFVTVEFLGKLHNEWSQCSGICCLHSLPTEHAPPLRYQIG